MQPAPTFSQLLAEFWQHYSVWCKESYKFGKYTCFPCCVVPFGLPLLSHFIGNIEWTHFAFLYYAFDWQSVGFGHLQCASVSSAAL